MTLSLPLFSASLQKQFPSTRPVTGKCTTATRRWMARLLRISLLLLIGLSANAQTQWTQQEQTLPSQMMFDVAYGAGRYVAVGNENLIRVSTDGVSWKTQFVADPSSLAGALTSIVYANNQFVVVGSYGRVLTSVNGLTWVDQVSGTKKHLEAIAYGGGRFMAVGNLGTAITSPDGINWTTMTTGVTGDLNDVTYGNGWFVVVGDYNLITTTPNGTNWTARTSGRGPNVTLRGVTFGKKGSFVVVGSDNTIITSTDCITWQDHSQFIYPPRFFNEVSYNPANGGSYVALGEGFNAGDVVTSPDGITWTNRFSGLSKRIDNVRAVNGKFIGLGIQGTICSSPDGIIWYSPVIDKRINLYCAAYGNGRYVAVGEHPSEENRSLRSNVALVSEDGKSYGVAETVHLTAAARCFYDVAFGAGVFVTVGEDGIIQSSTNGEAWTIRNIAFGQTLRGVTYGGGLFMAIGDKGFFARSVDGISWTKGYIGLAGQFNSITYANGVFVAVGEYGALATSPNGILWTARNTNTTKQLKSVAFGNGMWVAVGYDGLVCWSVNGVNWFSYIADPTARFNHVVFANNQFVAVSLDGKLYTSPTAFGWTARQSTVSAHLYGLTYGPGQFVAVGVSGTIITSPEGRVILPRQGRLGVAEPEVSLQVGVYPNPVETDFTVAIEGAGGQDVRLWLVDMQGRTITDRQIDVADSQHRESMSLGQHQPGIYLLQVSTPTQSKTIKLLKR